MCIRDSSKVIGIFVIFPIIKKLSNFETYVIKMIFDHNSERVCNTQVNMLRHVQRMSIERWPKNVIRSIVVCAANDVGFIQAIFQTNMVWQQVSHFDFDSLLLILHYHLPRLLAVKEVLATCIIDNIISVSSPIVRALIYIRNPHVPWSYFCLLYTSRCV